MCFIGVFSFTHEVGILLPMAVAGTCFFYCPFEVRSGGRRRQLPVHFVLQVHRQAPPATSQLWPYLFCAFMLWLERLVS